MHLRIITSPYNINGLVSVTEIECAYCAVQTECLNIIWINLNFKIALYHLSCHTKRLSGKQRVPNVTFDGHKSVDHHTIQINQPTRCISFTSLLLDVYVWLNMFQAPLRPSSGAYNCNRSLWFYHWSVAAGALLATVEPHINVKL